MATTTKKSSKKTDTSSDNGYPVELTKGHIAGQIASDFDYAAQALCTIAAGQTRTERSAKNGTPSIERNGVGFMSSHAVRGMALAAKINGGEKLSTEEKTEVQTMAGRYTKQLARHARETAPAAVKKQIAAFFTSDGEVEAPARKTKSAPRKTKAPAERRTRARKAKAEAA